MSPSTEPVQTFALQPSTPRLKLPALACDAHVHVFGPAARFPFSPARHITPVDAPKEALFALHQHLGIERCVMVQTVIHGQDNRVLEDAIAAGQGRYLGIALVPLNVADAELKRLAGLGFRGVRFNFMKHLPGAVDPEQLLALTQRLKAVGMHLQVHFESSLVHELHSVFMRSAVPVMVDHMGRVDAALGVAGQDFQGLIKLLRAPHMHVKVSGIDRVDPRPPQQWPQDAPYSAGRVLASHLLSEFPDRCVWGTDWPHPNHTHIPDDGQLVDALAHIAPSPAQLERLLVDNPAAFYRF